MQVFQMIFSFIICVTVCLAISSSTDLMVRSFDGSFIWFFIHLFLWKFFKINKNLTSLDSRNSLRYYCSSKEHLIYPSFFKILKPVIKNSQYHWRIGVQHKNRGAIEIQIYWNTDLLKYRSIEITFDGPVPPEWKRTPNAANTTASLCS